MGDLREPNGVVLEESSSSSSLVTSPSLSCLSSLGREVWVRAEAATGEIIRQVQPTVVSEERRKDVVDYVQRLLKGYLGSEVFPFGSVPLKTYLPDGDIDLTAFCAFNFEEAFANDVYSVLEAEDRNPGAKFVVKDVQYIRAEVKLVKCLVQNIVVDISFNQIGGLCALCFLEEIDRLIGKDHLFKRSIILIKAWCYYESRILGAHHGLISTYALETLVLYIFHLFHSSLDGPLAVLHKFLDYFSKFDWDNFCVSLSGPVRVAALPEIVVERSEISGRELLLSDDFMSECVRKFSVPSRGAEMNYRTFVPKFLNILDPLKENNNLGRSVSKGNFHRIRSAFLFGGRKLGEILLQPQGNIAEEVRKFFANTLDRHGSGQRPDVQDHPQLFNCNGFNSELSLSFGEPYRDQYAPEEDSIYSNNLSCESGVGSENMKHAISFREAGTNLEGISEHKKGAKDLNTEIPSVIESSKELSASTSHHSRDVNELSTSGVRDLSIREQDNDFCPSVLEETKLLPGDSPSASHLYVPPPLELGKMQNGYLDEEQHTVQYPVSSLTCSKMAVGRTHLESNGFLSAQECSQISNENGRLASTNLNFHSSSLDADAHSWLDSHRKYRGTRSAGAGRHETVDLLSDLSGEVDRHLDNLHHGRWWYDQGLAMPVQPIPLAPSPMFQPNVSWDTVQLRPEGVSQMNVNGVAPRPAFFPTNPPAAHFVDEMPKTRGTGTYFPVMNHYPYRDRASPKGRHQGQLKSPRVNGRGPIFLDRNPQVQGPVRQGNGRPKFSDNHESSPRGMVYRETNGFVQAQEKGFEYDPARNPPPGVMLPLSETCRPPESDPSPGSQNDEPVLSVDDSRLSENSYQLKDDEDFPPLGG